MSATADKTELLAALNQLEMQRRLLVQIRNEKRRTAELAIARADTEFDRQVMPVGRKINAIREQLEALKESEPQSEPRQQRSYTPRPSAFDPDWSDEDIRHFQELKARK